MEEIVSSSWTQWGFLGVAVALGLFIIRDLRQRIADLQAELVAVRTEHAAALDKKDARISALSDKLVDVSVQSNTNAYQSQQLVSQTNATANQLQSIVTSLQSMFDRVSAVLAQK